jgi:hypothetical protein
MKKMFEKKSSPNVEKEYNVHGEAKMFDEGRVCGEAKMLDDGMVEKRMPLLCPPAPVYGRR